MSADHIEKTFWTGGSESTFWVLRILSDSSRDVEPHYIVDPERSSAALEIRTVAALRERIEAWRPEWSGRIRDLRVTHLSDIPAYPDLTAAYDRIREAWYLGLQYLWLADYCRWRGEGPLDLCVGNNGRLGKALLEHAVRSESELENFEVRAQGDALTTLMSNFRLPVVMVNKEIMNREAAARGWTGIMDETWFCHQPVAGRYTCGTCRPCVYMMDWGQRSRLDWMGKLRFYSLELPKRALPQALKNRLRRMAGRGLKRFLRA